MTEPNQTSNQPVEAPATPPPKKGGIFKYVIIGLIALVLVVAVAAATVMMLGRQDAVTPADSTAVALAADSAHGTPVRELTDDEILDSLLAAEGGDQGVLEMLEENLAALDYDMDSIGVDGDSGGPTPRDSLEATDWLKEERQRLTTWEAQLGDRQKELARLDEAISRKMLVLEQAESARIASLARLYDGMDSRAVAKLMSSLDDETVVSILPRMKAKNASQVLQLLPPARAAKLSKQMITIAEN